MIIGVKVRLESNGSVMFYYPDVMVAEDTREKRPLFREYAKLVADILPLSSENPNRFEKFHNYIQIEALEEYIVVAQDKLEVTVYRRANNWRAKLYTALS
jgi:Uma2 family endonuclease